MLEQQELQHQHLLLAGKHLLASESLGAKEEALASRTFSSAAQALYLLAPWLQAGFRLNFPENLATRDNDRRELGPTLVAGTRESYGRLEQLTKDRLPPSYSWLGRFVHRVLQPDARWYWRGLGYFTVVRPLRDVLGLSRTRVPLSLGLPLEEHTQQFFSRLGVNVRSWPDVTDWRHAQQESPKPAGQQWIQYGAPSTDGAT